VTPTDCAGIERLVRLDWADDRVRRGAVDSLAILLKAKTWLIKTLPFLARWGQNTTPNP
jgi:hypothetical protein